MVKDGLWEVRLEPRQRLRHGWLREGNSKQRELQVQKPWGRNGTNKLEFMKEGSEKTREALAGRGRHRL